MKSFCECLLGLCYKHRMAGMPVDSLAYVFGDNQSIFSYSSKPHSILKKKTSIIANHFVRGGASKNEWRNTCLNTHINPSDACALSLCLVAIR